MNVTEVMAMLEQMGNSTTKNVLLKHGAVEPLFGVKVSDLKVIQKKVKKDHQLALELYKTGNSDAMYLAGLIADEKAITKAELENWVKNATWSQLCEYTVAWIAAESKFGWDCGNEWIDSDNPLIASAGWNTLSNWVAMKKDEELDIEKLKKLLSRISKKIHKEPNRVRYCMNNFVISLGGYVKELTEEAKKVANQVGRVQVYMGETACKVPEAFSYIEKIEKMGRLGKKKNKARC
jgi:3-methyladenine DNA glycosylase AlkD